MSAFNSTKENLLLYIHFQGRPTLSDISRVFRAGHIPVLIERLIKEGYLQREYQACRTFLSLTPEFANSSELLNIRAKHQRSQRLSRDRRRNALSPSAAMTVARADAANARGMTVTVDPRVLASESASQPATAKTAAPGVKKSVRAIALKVGSKTTAPAHPPAQTPGKLPSKRRKTSLTSRERRLIKSIPKHLQHKGTTLTLEEIQTVYAYPETPEVLDHLVAMGKVRKTTDNHYVLS